MVAIKNNTTYFCKIIQSNGDTKILLPAEQSASSAYTICTVEFFENLHDEKTGYKLIIWTITNSITDDTSSDATRCKIAVSKIIQHPGDIKLRLRVADLVTEKDTLEWSYKSGTVGTVTCDFEPSTS